MTTLTLRGRKGFSTELLYRSRKLVYLLPWKLGRTLYGSVIFSHLFSPPSCHPGDPTSYSLCYCFPSTSSSFTPGFLAPWVPHPPAPPPHSPPIHAHLVRVHRALSTHSVLIMSSQHAFGQLICENFIYCKLQISVFVSRMYRKDLQLNWRKWGKA